MRRGSVLLAVSVAAAVVPAATLHHRPLAAREAQPLASVSRVALLRSEAVRLRSHFDSVDGELRTRDVAGLGARQRASRARLISWLREYRDAGVFPVNDRFPGRTVPFFRDSRGTLCAMAYLIDRSGRRDIVDRVERTRNNAYIRDLADDRALVAWLDSAGLSVAEAARIQPQYDGGGWPALPAVVEKDSVSTSYALASMALGGISLATAAVNVIAPRYASGILGVLAGGTELAVGISRLDQRDGRGQLAVAHTALGSVALVAGIRGIMAARGRTTPASVSRREHGMLLATTVAPSWTSAPGGGVGFAISTRF